MVTITVEDRFDGGKITYEIAAKEGGHGGADPDLVDSFIRAIKGEKVQSATFYEGMISTAIGQAAELSKEEDRTVFIQIFTIHGRFLIFSVRKNIWLIGPIQAVMI